jgi:hypothetical protein
MSVDEMFGGLIVASFVLLPGLAFVVVLQGIAR